MKRAVYPGTFDPVTNGHIDIIKRAAKIFDELIVLVAVHKGKKTLFPIRKRKEMLEESIRHIKNAKVEIYEGLVAEYIKKNNILAMIRGMRAVSDFEFEFQMALMNRHMFPGLEILFLFPDEQYTYLTSSIIKEIASFGGDISPFVPPLVNENIKRIFHKQEE